jgi:hypothetical protein
MDTSMVVSGGPVGVGVGVHLFVSVRVLRLLSLLFFALLVLLCALFSVVLIASATVVGTGTAVFGLSCSLLVFAGAGFCIVVTALAGSTACDLFFVPLSLSLAAALATCTGGSMVLYGIGDDWLAIAGGGALATVLATVLLLFLLRQLLLLTLLLLALLSLYRLRLLSSRVWQLLLVRFCSSLRLCALCDCGCHCGS